MSEVAKKARDAMKNKAKRLASGDPHAKVDASGWTPPEPLNTEAKTGLRPVSRRAYKSGGKVEGEDCAPRADRKPRKSGGEVKKWVNAKINRNVKEANGEEFGKPHVGGMKKGGRAHKMDGGINLTDPRAAALARMQMAAGRAGVPASRMGFVKRAGVPLPGSGMKKGGTAKDTDISQDKKLIKKAMRQHEVAEHGGKHSELHLKKGGSAKKADGGSATDDNLGPNQIAWLKSKGISAPNSDTPNSEKITDPNYRSPQQRMGKLNQLMQEAQDARLGIPSNIYGSARETMRNSRAQKAAERREIESRGPSGDDLAKTVEQRGQQYFRQKSLRPKKQSIFQRLRSIVNLKQGGRTKRADGGPTQMPVSAPTNPTPADMEEARGIIATPGSNQTDRDWANQVLRTKKKAKGGATVGEYIGSRPKGGRVARKSGGATKGKTSINIVISPSQGAPAGGLLPPSARPPVQPVAVPPPAGAPTAQAPVAMPVPMPMAGAPGAGMGPMGRKTGGRVGNRKYRSYKDMDAGAGSGLGRLEKIKIQESKR